MDSGQQREGRPHPILKFIGTALTVLIGAGLLTTLLTIESEGRERDAALKGSLVKDISTSLARTSLTARFIVTGSYGVEEPNIAARPSRLRQRYNEGQQAWEQAAASIRAQLQAYYKDPKVAEDWDGFATTFGRFYQLSYPLPAKGTSQRKRNLDSRRKWTAEIQSYLEDEAVQVSWKRLAERTGGDSYARE